MSSDVKVINGGEKKGATKAISLKLSLMFAGLLVASILIAEVLVLGFGFNLVRKSYSTTFCHAFFTKALVLDKVFSSFAFHFLAYSRKMSCPVS